MDKRISFKCNTYITIEDKYLNIGENGKSSGRLHLSKTLDETCIFYLHFFDEYYLLQAYNGDYIKIKTPNCFGEDITFSEHPQKITLGILHEGGTVFIDDNGYYLSYDKDVSVVRNAEVCYSMNSSDASPLKIHNCEELGNIEIGCYQFSFIHHTKDQSTYATSEYLLCNNKINPFVKKIEYELFERKDGVVIVNNLRFIYDHDVKQIRTGNFTKYSSIDMPVTALNYVDVYKIDSQSDNGDIVGISFKTIYGECVEIIYDRKRLKDKRVSSKRYKFSEHSVFAGFDVKLNGDKIVDLYPIEYSTRYLAEQKSCLEDNWWDYTVKKSGYERSNADVYHEEGLVSLCIRIKTNTANDTTKLFGFLSRTQEDIDIAENTSVHIYCDNQMVSADLSDYTEYFDEDEERGRGYFEFAKMPATVTIELRIGSNSNFFLELQKLNGNEDIDKLWQSFEFLQHGAYRSYLRPKWKSYDLIATLSKRSLQRETKMFDYITAGNDLLSTGVFALKGNFEDSFWHIIPVLKRRRSRYEGARVYRTYHEKISGQMGSSKIGSVIKCENVMNCAKGRQFDTFEVKGYKPYETLGEFAADLEKIDENGRMNDYFAVYGFSHYSRCFNLKYDIAPIWQFMELKDEDAYWQAYDYQHGYALADILYYMDKNAFPNIPRDTFDVVLGDPERLGEEIENSSKSFWNQYDLSEHKGLQHLKTEIESYLQNTTNPFFEEAYQHYKDYISFPHGLFFFKCQMLCNRQIMEYYLDMQRTILEKVSYKKELISKEEPKWKRVWAFMGERIYSIFSYHCVLKHKENRLNCNLAPVICYKSFYKKEGVEEQDLSKADIKEIRRKCCQHYLDTYTADREEKDYEYDRERYNFVIFTPTYISVYEHSKFNRNQFPKNVSEEYGLLYEHNGNVKKLIHRYQIGERYIYYLPWRVKPSQRYKELAQICGMVFVHMLGENNDKQMKNIVDVSLYAEAVGPGDSKLYIMLDKESKTICAYDLYDSEKVYRGKTVEIFVKTDPLTVGIMSVGFDFDKKEFYIADLDGNETERMRFITLLSWEGYYDTYFPGSYIFEMPIWG